MCSHVRSATCAVIAALIFLSSTSAYIGNAAQSATVCGEVKDPFGDIVQGSVVTAIPASGSRIDDAIATQITDDHGKFCFSLPPGCYRFRAVVQGIGESVTQPIAVPVSKASQIELWINKPCADAGTTHVQLSERDRREIYLQLLDLRSASDGALVVLAEEAGGPVFHLSEGGSAILVSPEEIESRAARGDFDYFYLSKLEIHGNCVVGHISRICVRGGEASPMCGELYTYEFRKTAGRWRSKYIIGGEV